ncbi:MAG TPA: histidine phosphatase family protein [Opitutaceae bacterium]|jgi:broad specificity phosphatase PhoE|nr:histidine phosphatase family protein [Opitutaceae bacterium]
MAAQIFLIRHGETQWSLTGRHTGRTDLPLTENGERDATRLHTLLQKITFTHVLTSPLQRARQTCELAGFSTAARVEPDLQEWDYGNYEGRTTAEIHTEQARWNLFQDGCPQGESVEQISQRADRLLAAVRSMDGTVALFSHGHFLRALAVRWIGRPVQQGQHFALDTASLSILDHEHPDRATPVISLWNAKPARLAGEDTGP